jgi:hypothetical protein
MSETTAPVDTSSGTDTGSDTTQELDTSAEEQWELEDGKDETGNKRTKKVPLSEARKLAQKGYGADKIFNEAAQAREEAKAMKGQMAQLAKMFKEDPWAVMKAFGLDPNVAIKSKFERDLAESLLDPKDKKIRAYESELQHHRRVKAEQEAAQEEQLITAKVNEYQNKLMSKIDEALKQSGVPNNATTVGEIGRYLQSLHGKTDKNGNEINVFDIPLTNIVKFINSRYTGSFNESAAGMDEETLLNTIDPKVLKKIMAAQTKRLEASGTLNRRNAPVNNIDGYSKDEPVKKSQREIEREHTEKIRKLDEAWKARHPNR